MQANFSQSVENLVFLTHLFFLSISRYRQHLLSHDTHDKARQELGIPNFLTTEWSADRNGLRCLPVYQHFFSSRV